jgi:flagellar FliL protein
MSTAETPQDAASNAGPDEGSAEGAATPKKKSPLVFVVAGVLLGTGAGAFGIAPVVGNAMAKSAHTKAAHAAADSAATEAIIVPFDNLVLNPAESDGARFLMVSAAIQVRAKAVEDALKARNSEVRDRIIAVLGRKTVAELTDIQRRDGIKAEVLATVGSLFPKGDVLKIYFPQFVVQ